MQKKTIVIGIVSIVILSALLALGGGKIWREKGTAQQERCSVPQELKDFVYEGSFRSPEQARFILRMKLPPELIKQPGDYPTIWNKGAEFNFWGGNSQAETSLQSFYTIRPLLRLCSKRFGTPFLPLNVPSPTFVRPPRHLPTPKPTYLLTRA